MSDDERTLAYQDDFMAVTAFTELLTSLDAHKQKRLHETVRFAMTNAHFANDLLEELLKCIDDHSNDHQKRLAMLLLVDRLMKLSNDKMNKAADTPDCAVYVERLMSELGKLVCLLVPGPDVIATTVRKVLQGWRKSLSTHYEHYRAEFDEAEAYLKTQESASTALQIPDDTQHLINSLFRPQQQRGGIGNEEHKREHAEIQRKIEEDRDRHKRVREESWVRPDFPDPYSDGEWWNNSSSSSNSSAGISSSKTSIVLSNVETGPGQMEFADLWMADVNTLKSTFWDQLAVEARRAEADLDNDSPTGNCSGVGGIIDTRSSRSNTTPMRD
ncbi:hypothetical protein SeLEV6574_g00155 [Synchytrium endobioticum]|uniref:CTD kinase subunit gamma Ctk3 N-terminal domain-containing protein n=1 Tax=Synchytrium endobioticum TaxID=286115 RepID=A0A507DKH5_9FUNG|nr:hypothetical protein SeLEV6574_g00155 [Synchytrium endobioticum]